MTSYCPPPTSLARDPSGGSLSSSSASPLPLTASASFPPPQPSSWLLPPQLSSSFPPPLLHTLPSPLFYAPLQQPASCPSPCLVMPSSPWPPESCSWPLDDVAPLRAGAQQD
ncbi:hypothetical protein PAXINDRAFT_5466 [Paxillus involutus ATCC 200175]|nr:hypothetical protein PAXINDRAFT_5466 [Paxillus involutus ATCC 200175]